MGTPKKAVVYVRVSSGEQADSGLGLTAQDTACRAACAERGWVVAEQFVDAGRSGRTMKGRPQFSAALAALDAGEAEVLVVKSLSRLSRSVADFGRVVERAVTHGWSVLVIDQALDLSTANGRLTANVLIAVSQWEAEITSERTKDALAVARATGTPLGRTAGYSQATAARAVAMVLDGVSVRAVAAQLGLQPTQVQRLVTRARVEATS